MSALDKGYFFLTSTLNLIPHFPSVLVLGLRIPFFALLTQDSMPRLSPRRQKSWKDEPLWSTGEQAPVSWKIKVQINKRFTVEAQTSLC